MLKKLTRRLSRSNSQAISSEETAELDSVTAAPLSPARSPKALTTPKGAAPPLPTTPKAGKPSGLTKMGSFASYRSYTASEEDATPPESPSSSSMTVAERKDDATKSSGASQVAMRRATLMLNAPAPAPKAKPTMVRTGLVGEVSDTIALYVTTWNMAGIAIPDVSALDAWLPYGFDLYVIALQECKKPSAMDKAVLEHLGGEEKYESFKTTELGNCTVLVLARQKFFKGGVLAPTRLNGVRKFEIKSKGIMGGGTGRGAILVQILFHNTIMAFLAVQLEDSIDGFATRVSDLDWILRQSGVILPDQNDIGTPALHTVQHIFLLGDFGVKLSPRVTDVSGRKAWSVTRWNAVRDMKDDEFVMLKNKLPTLDEFYEQDVAYPPTYRRHAKVPNKVSPRLKRAASVDDIDQLVDNTTVGREPSPSILAMFEHEFDTADLFDSKLFKKEGVPSWQGRIMHRTHEQFDHLINPGVYLSSEMMRLSPNVPVFCTYRVNGVDKTLLKRWQVITGNMPPENASRTDERMVTGMVDELVGAFQQSEEAERRHQEMLSKMKKCLRCHQPLSLQGGDVDLGEKGAFHRGCFTCEDCGRDLFGNKIMHVEDKWLCSESYERVYRTPCPVCKLVIDHGIVRCGKNEVGYHSTCYRCTDCKRFLFNGQDVLPHGDFEDKPYCPDCHAAKRSQYCNACTLPFKPGEAAVMGFHKDCFRCRACDLDMSTTSLKVVVREYYVFCQTHAQVDIPATGRPARKKSVVGPNIHEPEVVEQANVEDEFDLSNLPPPPPLPPPDDILFLNLPPPPPLEESESRKNRLSVVHRPRVVVDSSDEEDA